ncbi:hypothetical protein [Pseudomonas cerasi]|uniref:hypothetical protein n=1 Tax=Pseudomonas cerasi TaxID=1583341 RepID=UPI00131A405D|nr:hypothetical protein [Pseudomonas cerasi]
MATPQLKQCISVYNALLREYGFLLSHVAHALNCAKAYQGAKSSDLVCRWAKIERIDLTTNIALGEGNVLAYLRGVSSQRNWTLNRFFYIQMAELFLGPKGQMGRAVVFNYRKGYDKAFEMDQNLLPKIKRLYGEDSEQFKYVLDLRNYCFP